MKIILTKQCKALTGTLDAGLGYHIQKRKNGFFSKRNSNGFVPRDGHWRFIVACAELKQMRLYIAEIRVEQKELAQALYEAGHFVAAQNLRLGVYNARDVLNLKVTFGL